MIIPQFPPLNNGHGCNGCTETFMHENAIGKHRRDSTYTVPYVPAVWICAARDHEYPRMKTFDGNLAVFVASLCDGHIQLTRRHPSTPYSCSLRSRRIRVPRRRHSCRGQTSADFADYLAARETGVQNIAFRDLISRFHDSAVRIRSEGIAPLKDGVWREKRKLRLCAFKRRLAFGVAQRDRRAERLRKRINAVRDIRGPRLKRRNKRVGKMVCALRKPFVSGAESLRKPVVERREPQT